MVEDNQGPPIRGGLNLNSIVRHYIDSMLGELQGRKALILDQQTLCK